MSIQPLPPDVVAQIRSSTTITSLNVVISELVKNALDAAATKISVDVDYGRGGCVVEDDGMGILPSEFAGGGGLGKPYRKFNLATKSTATDVCVDTSKSTTHTPLHGSQGSFLASLSAMALVSVTSHHHQHRSYNSLTMHKSEVISRQTPATGQQYLKYSAHGTKVTVRDLFGAMPVRVKQRAILAEKQGGNVKDWEELKRQLVLLLLAWNQKVSITICDNESHQKYNLRAPELSSDYDAGTSEVFICSLLSQASLITSDDITSWVSISASTPKLTLSGAISLEPNTTKNVQFLSLGIHPLVPIDGQSMLHDEINRLFSNSSFGNEDDTEDLDDTERRRRANDARFKSDGFTIRELKGGRKGIDRWPKFYLRILPSETFQGLTVGDILDHGGNRLSLVLELMQAMIQSFLTKYHFRPKEMRRQQTGQGKQTPSPRKRTREPIANQSPIHLRKFGSAAEQPQSVGPCLNSSKPIPSLDLFGPNVQLPLFRLANSQVDNSLETWSRIKIGISSSRQVTSPLLQDGVPLPMKRPSTAPPSTRRLSFPSDNLLLLPKSIKRSLTPLISKNGRLARKPFEEVIVPDTPRSPSHETLPKVLQQDDCENNLELWINPITKARSFVNKRTGLTVPEKQAVSKQTDSDGSFNTQIRLTARPNMKPNPTANAKTSPWLTNVLKSWKNPVFQPTELAIPQLSYGGAGDQMKDFIHGRNHHCSQTDIERAFKESSAGLSGRISKVALKRARIVSQVDNKFILASVSCSSALEFTESEMLVMIDQHAADERIRIESLMTELCTPSDSHNYGVRTNRLAKSIVFEVPPKEIALLQSCKPHFANWGILYEITAGSPTNAQISHASKSMSTHSVVVQSLPLLIQERCKQDPRLLIELIRTELWRVAESNSVPNSLPTKMSKAQNWLEKIHTCPQGLIDMMNSRACRSAIMFNDVLTRAQCEILVRKLADCMFPFQCAHGRPSLVPLVDLAHLAQFEVDGEETTQDGEMFGSAFKKWGGSLSPE